MTLINRMTRPIPTALIGRPDNGYAAEALEKLFKMQQEMTLADTVASREAGIAVKRYGRLRRKAGYDAVQNGKRDLDYGYRLNYPEDQKQILAEFYRLLPEFVEHGNRIGAAGFSVLVREFCLKFRIPQEALMWWFEKYKWQHLPELPSAPDMKAFWPEFANEPVITTAVSNMPANHLSEAEFKVLFDGLRLQIPKVCIGVHICQGSIYRELIDGRWHCTTARPIRMYKVPEELVWLGQCWRTNLDVVHEKWGCSDVLAVKRKALREQYGKGIPLENDAVFVRLFELVRAHQIAPTHSVFKALMRCHVCDASSRGVVFEVTHRVSKWQSMALMSAVKANPRASIPDELVNVMINNHWMTTAQMEYFINVVMTAASPAVPSELEILFRLPNIAAMSDSVFEKLFKTLRGKLIDISEATRRFAAKAGVVESEMLQHCTPTSSTTARRL